MKKISNQYKTKNTGKESRSFLYMLLMWLRLLVLSSNRRRIMIPNIPTHDNDNPLLLKLITGTIIEKKLVIIKKYQS